MALRVLLFAAAMLLLFAAYLMMTLPRHNRQPGDNGCAGTLAVVAIALATTAYVS